MVRLLSKYFLLSLALALPAASVALAQAGSTGQLTGTVTDQRGGAIPRATILAKQNRSGSEHLTVSDEAGSWQISSVPGGIYTVSIKALGFVEETFPEIEVEAGATVTVDATLKIGLTEDVTVVVSKYEQEVINAPATVSVISEQAIEALPSQNLADLMRAVPGMNVIQTSAASFDVNGRAASRTLTNTQLVMIDGRTIYQDYLGFVPWNVVPANLDEIKQMEVIHGPASAIWGANAMNGVVDIITKPPREMIGTTLTLGIGTFDRSGGVAERDRGSLYYVNVSHAQALNDRLAFKISSGANTQDAFARPTGTFPVLPSFKNEGTTQPKVDARVDYDFADNNQHLTFAGGHASSYDGILHGGLGGALADMTSSYGKVDYVRGMMRITGYINSFTADGKYLLRVDPEGQTIPWVVDNPAYHLEFSDLRIIREKHLISYGGSFRHADFDLSDSPEDESRNEFGVYFQDEIRLSKYFRLYIGARLDKFDYVEGALLAPRTTFMVKPTLGQSIRVSYNRAYVPPDVFSQYFQQDFMWWIDMGPLIPELSGYSWPFRIEGNRNLQELLLDAYEIGYTAVLAQNRVHLGAAFYINDNKNGFISQQSASYTSQNPPPDWPLPPLVLDALIALNAFGPGMGLPSLYISQDRPEGAKIRNKGLELSVDARFNRYMNVFGNYSWQAKPEATGFDGSAGNLPPTHRFNAGLYLNYKSYIGNVSVGYVGRAYWEDVVGYGGFTDAYTVVDTSVGIYLGRNENYTVMLKVANLANARVQNHIYGDVLKRRVTGEFRMRF